MQRAGGRATREVSRGSWRCRGAWPRPLLRRTGDGVVVRRMLGEFGDRPIYSWPDYEAHVDQLVSVLGEIGIRSDSPLRADGEEGTVAEILGDSMARFIFEQELPFSCKAYLHYLELPARRPGRRDAHPHLERGLGDQRLPESGCE